MLASLHMTYCAQRQDGALINFDVVAHPGRCVFQILNWSDDYYSRPYDAPTYGDAVLEAMRSQIVTLDQSHIYFEGIKDTGQTRDGAAVLSIELGS